MFLLFQYAEEKLGGIDVLVLNHMLNPRGITLWENTPKELSTLQTMMEVNFLSYVRLTTHALPLLEESHGRVGIVSSLAGVQT